MKIVSINRATLEKDREAKFESAIEFLNEALKTVDSITPAADTERTELAYLRNKTLGYREHLQTLTALSRVYIGLHDAFRLLPNGIDDFRLRLSDILAGCEQAAETARTSAGYFADAVTHPTDLGVLWMINSSMVTGTEVLGRYLRNIDAYYAGKEYWGDPGFDRLFGECPYPAYGADALEGFAGEVEPG